MDLSKKPQKEGTLKCPIMLMDSDCEQKCLIPYSGIKGFCTDYSIIGAVKQQKANQNLKNEALDMEMNFLEQSVKTPNKRGGSRSRGRSKTKKQKPTPKIEVKTESKIDFKTPPKRRHSMQPIDLSDEDEDDLHIRRRLNVAKKPKPEPKLSVKPETKLDIKLKIKLELKPEIKPEPKNEPKPEPKLEPKPDETPDDDDIIDLTGNSIDIPYPSASPIKPQPSSPDSAARQPAVIRQNNHSPHALGPPRLEPPTRPSSPSSSSSSSNSSTSSSSSNSSSSQSSSNSSSSSRSPHLPHLPSRPSPRTKKTVKAERNHQYGPGDSDTNAESDDGTEAESDDETDAENGAFHYEESQDEGEKLNNMYDQFKHGQDLMKTETPPGMIDKTTLLKHQKEALWWLLKVEKDIDSGKYPGRGAILADQMGLGKTITTLALMLCRPSVYPNRPVLVVVPKSLLFQWEREIKNKLSKKLNVYQHWGQKRTGDPEYLASYDVVLTTYGTVSSEFNDPESSVVLRRSKARGKRRKRALFKVRFHRIVLDEGHIIRNSKSKAARACCALKGTYRLVLTGTPIQNTLFDYYSLLKFIRYDGFGTDGGVSFRLLCRYISKQNKQGRIGTEYAMQQERKHNTYLNQLRVLIKCSLLRRTKDAVQLDLKPKIFEDLREEFRTEEERRFYDEIKNDAAKLAKKLMRNYADNYMNILVLLLWLCQAAIHKWLVKAVKDRIKNMIKALKNGISWRDAANGTWCMWCEEGRDLVSVKCRRRGAHIVCREHLMENYAQVKMCPICEVGVRDSQIEEIEDEKSKMELALADGDEGFVTSTKIEMLLEELDRIHRNDPKVKVLVYSRFTSLLDLIEIPLKKKLKTRYRTFERFDGTFSLEDRESAIDNFKANPTVSVMLISLMAGNLGLNLTAGSVVILMESWWNPFREDQAIDRVHRIGQKKHVRVVRLVIPDTIEEHILKIQKEKRDQAKAALSNGSFNFRRVTKADFKKMFGI